MPLMPTVVPDSDRPTVTYVAHNAGNIRLQLDAVDDVRDMRGRVVQKGYSLAAKFQRGEFTTNIANVQDLIEKSFKYKAGLIERKDALEARAIEAQLNGILELVGTNPELAKELRSRLTKQQMAAKKVTAKKPEPEPEEEEDELDEELDTEFDEDEDESDEDSDIEI